MFLGTFHHTLDDKGRLAIPARFRAELLSGLVVTRGTDRCLTVYPLAAWEVLARKLDALPIGDSHARDYRRVQFGGAEQTELDKQGRIVLSERLRNYAGLTADVAVVGVSSFIELWDQATWEALETRVETQSDELAAHLAEHL